MGLTHLGQRVTPLRAAIVLLVVLALSLGAWTLRPEPDPVPLASVRQVLAAPSPIVVSVLGDSTGNERGEWVEVWARDLARHREVRLHMLDQETLQWERKPIVMGKGRGAPVTIWNAGIPGSSPDDFPSRLDYLEPDDADLVMLNFGHNTIDWKIGDQLSGLADALGSVRMVTMTQNPSYTFLADRQADTNAATEKWAARHGVPVVDVAAAFGTRRDLVMADDKHPTPAGSLVWGEAVAEALN